MREYIYLLMNDRKKGIVVAAIKIFLNFLSLIYSCVIRGVLSVYSLGLLKPYSAGCPVISVGNITLGGTGKTPLVIAIAQYLKARGKRVVILSRGYKGDKAGGSSDEVYLLRKRLEGVPVLIGADRVKTARQAEALKADVIILDDGFQHWRLKRTFDIVVIAGKNPFGNEKLLPRGVLREPLSSLNRADVFLINKIEHDKGDSANIRNLKSRLGLIKPTAPVFTSSYVPSALFDVTGDRELQLEEAVDKRVALLCGIADPVSFKQTVKSLGAEAAIDFFFMDHHKYVVEDMLGLIAECKKRGVGIILTTEKDVPRLSCHLSLMSRNLIECWALRIDMKIEEEERFFGGLRAVFIS